MSASSLRRRGRRWLAALCLAVPYPAMLWVGSYASAEPALFGFPFFYWYQLLWIPLSVVCTAVAYLLVVRWERDGAGRAGAQGSGEHA